MSAITESPKLIIKPDQDSYSFRRTTSGYVRSILDGGSGRYRRDVLGSSEQVAVQFTLAANDYMYICALYRVFVNDMNRFRIDLILEDEGLVECEAWFVPDTMTLTSQVAQTYVVSATLEVIPPEYDLSIDRDLVYLISILGRDWLRYLDLLQVVVNEKWPIALEIK